MKAQDQTDRMLTWWRDVGIESVDLAVRRPRSATDDAGPIWIWQRAIPLDGLPRLLPWTRAENTQRADVYARPARGSNWPVVLLDDLAKAQAIDLTTLHPGLCVHTSPAGGCQLWLRCERPLDEEERYRLQKDLACLHDADPGSVSGEHLGRLAGYRNWKRHGPWVNVLAATLCGPPITTLSNRQQPDVLPTRRRSQPPKNSAVGLDTSESGREWGWVMGALQSGLDPAWVYHQLVARARPRRGADAERYARRTVNCALTRLADSSPPQRGSE